MNSIVIDLQDEILSSDCDIVQILRRAHVIAVKLGLKEFDQWISYELNGYPDQNACPDYRKVRGTLFGYLRKQVVDHLKLQISQAETFVNLSYPNG